MLWSTEHRNQTLLSHSRSREEDRVLVKEVSVSGLLPRDRPLRNVGFSCSLRSGFSEGG